MSETAKRIASAVVALPVYVFAFATDSLKNLPLLAVTMIITLACLYEFYQISDKGEGKKPYIAEGLILGGLVNIIMYLYAFGKIYGFASFITGFDARVIFAVMAVLSVWIFSIQIFKRPIEGGIYSMAVTIFGVVFFAFSFSHILLMKALRDGVYYIFILHAVIMLNDTGAYFGGVFFGTHKAKFKVSPNKSWEGYFSGLLFSILGMIIFSQVFEVFFAKNLFSMIEAAALGIVFCFIGNIGDLVESAIKRDGSIKDSGSLIPGHGGVWDVFDSMFVSFPLFYYYLVIKGV